MNPVALQRIFFTGLLLLFGIAFSVSLNTINMQVLAQEPTPIPTATMANTPTPTEPLPTATTEPGSATATSTPSVGSTPSANRLITFRVDTDKVDTGECVNFTWVVKGDVGYVEFNIEDDGVNPELVSDAGNRAECPTEDTEYRLFVLWLDNTQTTSDKIKVKINESGSSGSSSDNGSGTTTYVPPGTFIAVTPVLVDNPIIQGTPVGILSQARLLPETGQGNFDTEVLSPVPTYNGAVSTGTSTKLIWLAIVACCGGYVLLRAR